MLGPTKGANTDTRLGLVPQQKQPNVIDWYEGCDDSDADTAVPCQDYAKVSSEVWETAKNVTELQNEVKASLAGWNLLIAPELAAKDHSNCWRS